MSKKKQKIFDTYIGLGVLNKPTTSKNFKKIKNELHQKLHHLEILETIVDTLKSNNIKNIGTVMWDYEFYHRQNKKLEKMVEEAIQEGCENDVKYFKQKIKERDIIEDALAMWGVK